jgi:L-fuconolactonase
MMIDAQIHVWSPDTSRRPWVPGSTPRAQGPALSAEQALAVLDDAGVARAVLVPPSWVGEDNSDALAAARHYPDRFAVMGRFDPTVKDGEERLARWREVPGMLGVRMTFHLKEHVALLREGRTDWFWAACERFELPVMVYVPGWAEVMGPIAARHPKLRIILDHMARPHGKKDDEAFADLDKLLALAKYPGVAVKVSSIPCYTTQPYPFANLDKHLRRIHEAFGARRMLWGTDYTRLPVPYREAVRHAREGMPFLGAADREWVVGRACAEWLGWSL